jgi:hypothetical protein
MVSPVVCRAAHATATALATLVFLAAALPTCAVAAESDAQHDRLQNQVQEILSRDGPYSPALLEPLVGLGQLYESEDDQILALATLERAVQIVRINNGLHTLAQVPLLRQLIRIEESIGNDAGAWDREQKLLTLLRRHLDDLRTVPVLREIADKQMQVLAKVLAGKRPPQVVLGCFYQEFPNRDGANCRAGSRRTVVQGMLAEAQRNYADAIRVMLQNGLYGSDELRELELKVLNGVDLVRSINHSSRGYPVPMVPPQVNATNLEPWRSRMAPVVALADWEGPDAAAAESDDRARSHFVLRHVELMDPYQRGRQSLQRLYAYGAASSSPTLRKADAVVQLADWDLLHSKNGQALETYAAAYAELDRAGVAPTSIAQLFSPPTPVVLPAFKPNPLAADEARAATGHIDVAFEITKYGRSRAVEIRDAANATPEAQHRLVALIMGSRFRPRATAGEFADTTPVVLRYHLYE